MGRKTDYTEVKNYIENICGLILLSDNYDNSRTKLNVKCKNNHLFERSFSQFKKVRSCPECNKNEHRIKMYNEVKEYLSSINYTLISTEYIRSDSYLDVMCDKNHTYKVTQEGIKAGNKCPECAIINRAENRRTSIEELNLLFEEKGLTLLTDSYDTSGQKLKYICKKHHDLGYQYTTREGIIHGQCCKKCVAEKISESQKEFKDYDSLYKEFDNRGLILLPDQEYINCTQKLYFTCKNHLEKGVQEVSWVKQKNRYGCKFCSFEESSRRQRKDYNEIVSLVENKGFKLLTKEDEFINCQHKLKYYCDDHGEFEGKLGNFLKGYGCPSCALENRSKENHYAWEGGITKLKKHLRERRILQWKIDSAKQSNFKCVLSGDKYDDIHHLYPFSKILKETLNELNLPIKNSIFLYSEEELTAIEDKCLEIHYRYPLGVALRKDIHDLFHKKYGYRDNTPEQFEEFKNNYFNGMYDKILKEAN